MRRIGLTAGTAWLLWGVGLWGQSGPPMPYVKPQFFTNAGAPCAGCKLTTYASGTTTVLATYTDATLGTANANPVILDSSGRANVFLSLASYKFVLTGADDSAMWTVDAVGAPANWNIPSFAGKVSYSASTTLTLASNAVVPTQNVHALDTAGGAANLNTITTTNTPAGFVLHLTGNNPGANPVTVKDGAGNISLAGGDYALNAAARWMSLILRGTTWYELARSAATAAVVGNDFCDCRLTLTTATPVTTADVTAATTIYMTPHGGNRISLYDGTATWTVYTFSELSIALGTDAANTNYDVFAYNNGGTPAIERLAWAGDTTRATALVLQDGVLVKSGTTTRRYIGTYRTTGSAGQTEDSFAKRFVWSYYHRVPRAMRVVESTASWTYSTASFRQANAATANQLAVVIGVAEVPLSVRVQSTGSNNSTINTALAVSIGEDSTTTPATGVIMQTGSAGLNATYATSTATLDKYPSAGYHYYVWLERPDANATTTWYGVTSTYLQTGIAGIVGGG